VPRSPLFAIGLLTLAPAAFAQDLVELRGSSTAYRYVDYLHPLRGKWVLDAFYIGVPGNNEGNLGVGYTLALTKALSVTPLVYATGAKEDRELGIKVAALILLDTEKWKGSGYFGRFVRLRGDITAYTLADTADLTRVFTRHWEAGLSTGFFHQDKAWNPQAGPLVKRNDRLGGWGLSYRFGSARELRITRTFTLGK
jgi:hypothetical protein